MVRKAIALNPKIYPRWWHAALGKNHFRKGEYREALVEFKNMATIGMVLMATVFASAWSLSHTTALTVVTPADGTGVMTCCKVSNSDAFDRCVRSPVCRTNDAMSLDA